VPPTVAAVVLNWNQSGLTLDCLATLRKSARPVDYVVVVDNGSRPADRLALSNGLAAGVHLVQLPANRGFAGGMNAGLAEAHRLGAAYAWLVNNDAFPEPDCLGQLLAAMEADPTLAAVTPHLVGADGVPQPAGGRYDAATGRNEFLDTCQLAEPVGAGGYWAVATAPLLRVAPAVRAGGFDERFFAYWEEIDLCLRLGAAGYRFRSVPEAVAVHLGAASSGGSAFGYHLYLRNRFRLVRKHAPAGRRTAQVLGLCREYLDNAGCYTAHGQRDKARAAVAAVAAGLLNETGRPRWLTRFPRAAGFVARHPWQLAKAFDWLGRRLTPAGGVA
jgi:GT2 family glycosyltransferase